MTEVVENHWTQLRQFTNARIALGRAGTSLPTRVNLQFQLDHARARDAVHQPLNFAELARALQTLPLPLEKLCSEAPDRRTYLQRPDLGRRLTDSGYRQLRQYTDPDMPFDVALVAADGLSATAVQCHAPALLHLLVEALQQLNYYLAPICLAAQARVALGDDIGEALGAKMVLVLIGERPGLSAADSLGVYLTFTPKRGCLDSERNCISNIRPQGLNLQAAADTCVYLVNAAFRKGFTGVNLKDESNLLESASSVKIPFFRDG